MDVVCDRQVRLLLAGVNPAGLFSLQRGKEALSHGVIPTISLPAQALAGEVDNRTVNVLLTYSQAGHSVGVAYQGLSGSTAMPYLIGTDAYFTNYMMAAGFMEAEERTWQLRYAYDFVALGIPGLTFSTRYNRGNHANPATHEGEGREWERDTDLGYTIQSGPLKNVSMLWRNASLRSNYQRDIDENRLILTYTLPLF